MSITYMIYFADVVNSIGLVLFLLLIILALLLTVLGGYIIEQGKWEELRATFKNLALCLVTTALLVAAIPSKQTMYLLAGVELAGQVANSEIGKKALDIVRIQVEKKVQELTK